VKNSKFLMYVIILKTFIIIGLIVMMYDISNKQRKREIENYCRLQEKTLEILTTGNKEQIEEFKKQLQSSMEASSLLLYMETKKGQNK
jgi:hypothetical protein